MAAAPALPASPGSTPGSSAPLSEGTRIINTFIAPSKTFTDLRRSAAWWGPFLLMVIASLAFVYVAGQKVGFRKAMENQMQSQPKAQARLENLPPDQREQQMEQGAKVTKIIAYAFPVIQLLILLFIAVLMFATFKFARWCGRYIQDCSCDCDVCELAGSAEGDPRGHISAGRRQC